MVSSELIKEREWLKKNKKLFDSIDKTIFTKDGLFPCKHLTKKDGKFWFGDINVSPNSSSSSVANYLFYKQNLWENSSVRIVCGSGLSGRVRFHGVSFQRAVEEALKKGYIKSQFYLPEKIDNVYYSNILLHVNRRKESNNSIIQLQAWMYCIDLEEVFYIHAESKDFITSVQHLDGAKIYLQKEDRKRLFRSGDKIKGDYYEKQFRIDGNIPMNDFYEIIKKYFPVKELVEEAFDFDVIKSKTV